MLCLPTVQSIPLFVFTKDNIKVPLLHAHHTTNLPSSLPISVLFQGGIEGHQRSRVIMIPQRKPLAGATTAVVLLCISAVRSRLGVVALTTVLDPGGFPLLASQTPAKKYAGSDSNGGLQRVDLVHMVRMVWQATLFVQCCSVPRTGVCMAVPSAYIIAAHSTTGSTLPGLRPSTENTQHGCFRSSLSCLQSVLSIRMTTLTD